MTPDPVMPEVLDGFRRALPAPAQRRRRRFAHRGVGVLVAATLIGGTAIAAVTPWNPFAGSPESYSLAPPDARQAATFGVLGLPQDDRDRSPVTAALLKRFAAGPTDTRPVLVRSVRFLRTIEGGREVITDGVRQREHVRARLSLVPLAGGERVCLLSAADFWADPGGPRPELTRPGQERPARLEDRVTGHATCGTVHQVRMKGLGFGSAGGGSLIGLVPDGVAEVRATTRTGAPVRSRVIRNSFELLAPDRDAPASPGQARRDLPPPSGQLRHGTLQWLDADGQVIRHLPW